MEIFLGRRNQKMRSATTMMENVLGNNGLNKTKDSAETKDKKMYEQKWNLQIEKLDNDKD